MHLAPILNLLRPEQWLKNLFVAAPLFFTPPALSPGNAVRVAVGIIAFCLLSSAVYVFNDYLDCDADRAHPVKRSRPLAAGTVGVAAALWVMIALVAAGLGLALGLGLGFAALAIAYLVINGSYSLGLKQVAIVDVLIVAIGFVLRVMGGAVLIAIRPSAWILITTGLLALFIALAKRRDDLVRSLDEGHRGSLAGYNLRFLDTAIAVILGALLVTYMVYTTDRKVMDEMGTEHLVYTVVFVIAGVLRYLQIMLVEERSGSPTGLVTTDPFLVATIGLWALTFAALIHG